MTSTHETESLSHVDLIALARLSCSAGANVDELTAAIAEAAPPDGSPTARERATSALTALRADSLATTPKSTKRSPSPRSTITDRGKRALSAAVGLDKAPRWTEFRDRYLPALALGLSVTSEQTSTLGKTEELTLTTLRQHFDVSQASTVVALCDAVIAKALGLPPGPITLLRLRAHVLARDLGIDSTVASTPELEALAARVAAVSQDRTGDGKWSLRQTLGRRWAYKVTSSTKIQPATQNTPLQKALPLTSPPHSTPPGQGHAPITLQPPVGRPPLTLVTPSAKPAAISADTLLDVVRETIPRIGSDGRFGPEKVFVSAIWHRIERDGRMPELSLDRFKHWLLTFNRDQLLDLARADTQGEMDDRLVEESEINDLGATFHFVVDRRIAPPGRGYHAR
jgi:hypothetical protein